MRGAIDEASLTVAPPPSSTLLAEDSTASTPAIKLGLPDLASYYPSQPRSRQVKNDRWRLCTGQETDPWFVRPPPPDLIVPALHTGAAMTPRDIEGLKRKLRKLGVPAPCIRNHIERTLTAKAMREKRHAAFLAEKATPFRPARPSYSPRRTPRRPRPPENCIACGARIGNPRRRTLFWSVLDRQSPARSPSRTLELSSSEASRKP